MTSDPYKTIVVGAQRDKALAKKIETMANRLAAQGYEVVSVEQTGRRLVPYGDKYRATIMLKLKSG